MSKSRLSERVAAYREALASGEIQETYESLVGIVQNLRTTFAKRYKSEFAVAKVLHGYLDFTYFYLQNEYLKTLKLKLALVLNHREARFELWLLGQTKDVQIRYWERLKSLDWVDEQTMPEYSIFEIPLLSTPNFDDSEALSEAAMEEFEVLTDRILAILEDNRGG